MVSRPLWGEGGTAIHWSPLMDAPDGAKSNIVIDIACVDRQAGICVGVLFPCLSTVRVKGLPELEPSTRSVTVIGAIGRKGGLIQLFELDDHSVVMQHATCDSKDFRSMVELCCGVGVATFGFKATGIEVQLAVEKQQRFAEKYLEFHPMTTVVCGDINSVETISEICTLAKRPGVLFAGFNCQPYSRAGSQQGALDDRSNSLHATLNIAYLLRTPIVILECVCEAATNKHVNQELDAFCAQCKYTRAEIQLKLEDLWPCKRERWWVILSASTLGKIPIRPLLPSFFRPTMVSQVLPKDLQLTPEDLDELVLSPYELERFMQFQKPVSKMLLNRGGLCPTLLHSLGSQVTACPCGCRSQGFSDHALSTRGLFGILMEAPGSVVINGIAHQKVRHPHPIELCMLSAIPVPEQWSKPLRLWLPGIGQQANPTQALWIMGNVLRHLEVVFQGVGTLSPQQMLEEYLERMLLQVRAINATNNALTQVPPPIVHENDDEEMPMVEQLPVACEHPLTETIPLQPHVGDEQSFTIYHPDLLTPYLVKLSSVDATVGHLKAAEVGMMPTINYLEVLDATTGFELPNDTLLAGRSIVVFVGPGFSPTSALTSSVTPVDDYVPIEADLIISPTMPFTVDAQESMMPSSSLCTGDVPAPPIETAAFLPPVEPLLALRSSEFLQMRPPIVASLQHVESMIRPNIQTDHRIQILETQGDSWADDEVRWHIVDLLKKVGYDVCIMLDPLIATTVIQTGNPSLIYQWHKTMPRTAECIVTVLWSDGHWVPQVWTWKSNSLIAHSWDAQGSVHRFNVLHDALAKALGVRTFLTHVSHRNFAQTTHCGICAIRFLHHFLVGRMLPTEQSDVVHLQGVAKEMFVADLSLNITVSRPWMWAQGMDASSHSRFLDLLVQHGVPPDTAESRAAVLTTAVGFTAVQRAVQGSVPWRSLKAIANQVRPPVQLVLPHELAAVVQAKIDKGIANPKKASKKPGQKPGAPQPPIALDPSKLQFDDNTFVSEDGSPLPMVAVSMLGPTATGIAIASPQDVSQFLKIGKVVSSLPLAVFVINGSEEQLQTSLTWAQARVPARCVVNQEPMLLTGFLVQMGGSIVSHATASKPHQVDFATAACVKVTVYRDGCTLSWNEFAKAPVKYILQCLLPLLVCDSGDADCSCSKYRKDDSTPIRDPVFDVWRRQWLSLSFRPSDQEAADIYAVNIRYLHLLENTLLSLSGAGGVFLEPRSLDGRDVCPMHQVIWMPRSTLDELQHLRQTMPQITGVVRMGSRLGLRTLTTHATEVNRLLRPDTVMLNSGPRQDYEIGPIPFGMDRAAVAALCESWHWKAKPVNPSRSIPGAMGMMWHVVAVAEPSATVFPTKVGDIVVSKLATKQSQSVRPSPVVASSATIKLCEVATDEAPVDPFVRNDPWNTPVAKLFLKNPPAADPVLALQQVEARIEKSVLAKIPKPVEAMEVDDDASQSQRLNLLEAQVQKLSQGQSMLEQRFDEGQRRTDAQFAQVHHQVTAQIESQGAHIEELFKGQLAQIESLLGKRSRHE